MNKKTKDLGIKTNTALGAFWENVLAAQKNSIINNSVGIEIAETVVELAKKRIAEEKKKLK